MRKFYSILLLLITFIFLTTYNPSEIEFFSNKNNSIFNIKNIKILNNNRIKKSDIESKLSKIYGRNIFFIKTKDIQNVIKNIYFLDTVEVKKRYPNTLIIKIFETEPIAILLKNNEYFLIYASPYEHYKFGGERPILSGLPKDPSPWKRNHALRGCVFRRRPRPRIPSAALSAAWSGSEASQR